MISYYELSIKMFLIMHIFIKLIFMYITSYMFVYWLTCSIYYVLDLLSTKIEYIRSFKIQQDKYIDFTKYKHTVEHVLLHQIMTIPFIILLAPLILIINNDMSFLLPTFFELVSKLGISLLIFDFTFYMCHYLCHCKYLYVKIHKFHHDWTAPIAAAAHYNHFIEHVVVNIFVPSISIIITGANLFTMMLWFTIATLCVTATHSGYWIFMATKHDNHHKYFNCEYGFVITDKLFGTNRKIK